MIKQLKKLLEVRKKQHEKPVTRRKPEKQLEINVRKISWIRFECMLVATANTRRYRHISARAIQSTRTARFKLHRIRRWMITSKRRDIHGLVAIGRRKAKRDQP